MTYSRVKKYQELRDGLKEEVGISKERVTPTPSIDENDDFLSFMKKDNEVNLEDTLTEAKTFEQMREEGSKELDKALKSAKESVGKEEQYNTRMDILSKIREPEKRTIKIDSVEDYRTEEFARGMFINNEVEEVKEQSLMDKLASMSPEEDVKKAEAFLQEERKEQPPVEEIIEEPVEEIEEVEEIVEEQESKVVKVMNVIIVILVIIFIALLGTIIYQCFF